MNRREALIALALLSAGCSARSEEATVALRRRTLPANMVRSLAVKLAPQTDRHEINRLLAETKAAIALISGDDLAALQPLLQPLPETTPTLPEPWQSVGFWNDQRYLLPWQWGVTAIAYNRRLVREPIRDWADLWRPDLQGHVVVPDHPREVIGLVQKKLGLGYNDTNYSDPSLKAELEALHRQVLFYSSSRYLQTLLIRDAWAAVGWTSDLWQARTINSDIEVVVPASGSAIWWEGWGLATATAPALFREWADTLYQPEAVQRSFNLSQAAMVMPVEIPPRLFDQRPDLAPDVLERSELWRSLTSSEAIALLDLWQSLA